jgi:hypothetical protein
MPTLFDPVLIPSMDSYLSDNCHTDPALAEVVARWSDLPEAVRSAIALMVKSAARE